MRRNAKYLTTLAVILTLASLVAPIATASVVAHATPSISPFANALASLSGLIAASAKVGAVKFAMFGPLLGIKPIDYSVLKSDSAPSSSKEPEAFPAAWFDSQTFTSASTSGNVSFFAATNSDKTLSNMQLAGQFPADEYFKLGEVHVDLLQRPFVETVPAATNALTGQDDDAAQLMRFSRATIQLTYRNKPYGPYPLSMCRPTGQGRSAALAVGAAATAASSTFWDAVGLIFEKQLTFGPTSNFGVTIFWPGQLTITQTTVVRVTLRGIHYRPVV